MIQRLLLEFAGCLLFFMTILHTAGKPIAPLTIGSALAVAIFATGGHMNPAVSAMFFLKDGFPAAELLALVATQMAAGYVSLKVMG